MVCSVLLVCNHQDEFSSQVSSLVSSISDPLLAVGVLESVSLPWEERRVGESGRKHKEEIVRGGERREDFKSRH